MAPNLNPDLFFYAMREVSLFDYISKPLSKRELVASISRAIAQFDALERLSTQEQSSTQASSQLLPYLPRANAEKAILPSRLWDGAFFVTGMLVGSIATILILILAYLIKTAMGSDIFPLIHLHELVE
ncbi:MAG: hypothetical protein N2035_06950 [Chthoniobacterales bacterium]|nr:hypothetical protein [Chthoniobacterales bacterium]